MVRRFNGYPEFTGQALTGGGGERGARRAVGFYGTLLLTTSSDFAIHRVLGSNANVSVSEDRCQYISMDRHSGLLLVQPSPTEF